MEENERQMSQLKEQLEDLKSQLNVENTHEGNVESTITNYKKDLHQISLEERALKSRCSMCLN